MELNSVKAPDPTLLNIRENRHPSIWFSKRFLVMTLLFLATALVAMQALMSTMSILEMTKAKEIVHGNTTTLQPPDFDWDSKTVGVVLNMVWYGGFLSPIGGTLSQKFGGSVTCGVSMMLAGLVSFITPVALVHGHFYLFLACRGLMGAFGAFIMASTSAVFSKWLPKKERPTCVSAIFNGIYVGAAIVHPLCGYIAYYQGWQMIFYTIGILSATWSIFWIILVRNSPSDDKWISKQEQIYILAETIEENKRQNNNYPYKAVLTSGAFWALTIGKSATNWGCVYVTMYYPFYINDKTQKNSKEVANISSIPQFFDIILIPIAGIVMGYWQNHSSLSATLIHKFYVTSQMITCAFLFAIITLIDGFFIQNVCFVIITVLLSYNKVVLELITVSIAPNHSGLVSGLSIVGQMLGTILSQTFIGFIVQNHRMDEWNICFITSAVILTISTVVFIFYGSSKPQSWSQKNSFEMNKDQNIELF